MKVKRRIIWIGSLVGVSGWGALEICAKLHAGELMSFFTGACWVLAGIGMERLARKERGRKGVGPGVGPD
jgi:uncharacterized membrane protein YjjB (DUF3815 family)